jgi:flagellar export protein FliJ
LPKPKYRLQPVLSVRERAKQAAAQALATRREQLIAAEAELARRLDVLAACRARQSTAQQKMLEDSTDGAGVALLVIHRTHLADLRRIEKELIAEVEAQRSAVAAAEIEVEKAITTLIEASREVQVIEKHQESWQQRTKREEARREQKLGDEIGAANYKQQR